MIVYKVASKTTVEFYPENEYLNLDMLTYLRKIKSLPIASSCDGKGVCKKCVCNKEILLCQLKVKDSPSIIEVDYL